MSDRVTIFDIAKEAGVSIATVSRAISGSSKVRPQTRDRVMRIVAERNFKPSMIATGLSKRKSHTIGMVVPLVENPYYTKLCLAAQQHAQDGGYSIALYQLIKGTLLTQEFIDLLIGRRPDGLIISGDLAMDASVASINECARQASQYMPVVMIAPYQHHAECTCLCSGLALGMRMAVRHLVRLGHRRIAMLGGSAPVSDPETREFAYEDEMRACGLEPYPYTSGDTLAEGEMCAVTLMSSLSEGERPTAMVCFNDLIAMGAMKQLKRMGLRIPEDIAMVGFDNQFFAGYTEPPLTTVDLRIERAAQLAVNLLMAEEPPAVFDQYLEPMLVVRESCGASLRPQPLSLKGRKGELLG